MNKEDKPQQQACGCGDHDHLHDDQLVSPDTEDSPPARTFSPLALVAIFIVRFYQQLISPLFPPSCRYSPTCSQYTLIALRRYGFFRGGWLGFRRILRCHPFRSGGYDPVP